jgi:WD40 repeat protein
MYDARSIKERSVKSFLLQAREAAMLHQHERVISLVACAIGEIHICERLPRYRSWLRLARKEAQVLRGESLVALDKLEDAIASFDQAHDIDYLPAGVPRPAWPAPGCRRVSTLGLKAMLGSAICMYRLGRYNEAKKRTEEILSVGPQMRRDPDPNSEKETIEDSRINITEWHNNARKLLHIITQQKKCGNGSSKSAPLHPKIDISSLKVVNETNPVSMETTDVVGQGVIGVPCTTQRYTWKVSGPLENSELAYKEVIVIERLQWSLIWVKSGILVWDYAKLEVIHWLTSIGFPRGSMPDLKEPEEIQCMHYVEAPIGGLLMMSTRPNTLFCVVNVDKLVRGARSSMVEALRSTLMESAVVSNPEIWLRRTSTLLGATNCYATSKSNITGLWRMAATSRDCLGVNIFGDGQIEPNSSLGPLALISDTPGNVLRGHDQPVCNMQFASPSSDILVTVCYECIIKVWDISKTNGSYLYSIRGYQTYVTKLCCSDSLLFTVPYPKRPTTATESSIFGKDEFEDGPFGSRSIGIWTLDNGKRVGTLRVSEDTMPGPVLDISIMPCYNQIVSAHCNGELHIWKYQEVTSLGADNTRVVSVNVTHLSCFKALRNAQEGFSLFVHPTDRRIFVATVRSLTIIHCAELPTNLGGIGANSNDKLDIDHKMNCGYCGKWDIENSSLCSGCKKVHFCDRKCQKKGWQIHKDVCLQWTKERLATSNTSS